ncbi:MAG: peptidoglycan-binding protein [Tuberibacillus sp.]
MKAVHRTLVKRATVATTITGTFLSIPALASAHFGHELLYKGKHDEHVKNLQEVLKREGYYKLSKPTGYFGPATEKAVKQFQSDQNIKADGVVGPVTKAHLSAFVQYEGETLKLGDRGDGVTDVQDHLKSLGYYSGNLDGIFGQLTRLAVLKFQKVNELRIDGMVGPETFRALHNSPKENVNYTLTGEATVKIETLASRKQISNTSSKVLYMSATAYTAYCSGCSGTTATGIDLRANPDAKVVAVDPSVIPLGTKLYVDGYGYAVAGDTGGAIKGNRIDLFMASRDDALHWGRRTVKVKILN